MTRATLFFFLIILVIFSSCQKEINIQLSRTTDDSTTHITPIFRVVVIYKYTVGEDSMIHLFQAVTTNGERSVIESEIDPSNPVDTINTLFTYNQQNQLINIKSTLSSAPSIVLSNYQLTWNGNRLTKVIGDTLGQFACSFDYTYTPSGSNTAITALEVPSRDWSDPSAAAKYKHKVTVNGQFRPIEEQWIRHTTAQSPLSAYHDTTNYYYNYSGNDLVSYTTYRVEVDTNSAVGLPTNIYRDTTISTYNRSASGLNIADTLRKIYGNDIYTMMYFRLLGFNLTTVFPFECNIAQESLFYSRPYNTMTLSSRSWMNGIFDSSSYFNNQLWYKSDNSFDAQGRLIRADVYDVGGTDVDYIIKVTYY